MRRDEVLAILQAHREDLRRLGVRTLSLFGSTARDEARPESDIDLLVEFADPATFDAFMDLKFYLEDLLGRRIDLVTSKALKPRIRPSVEREAILVA
jgi:predicted nucleotidyltransferase